MVRAAPRARIEYIGAISLLGESSGLADGGSGSPALDVGPAIEESERGKRQQ